MGSAEVVVASFNLHAGVDGWGRPFDVVEACKDLQADILVLQESWASEHGEDLTATVASALGFSAIARPLASGRRASPDPRAGASWKPPRDWRGSGHGIYLDSELPLHETVTRSTRFAEAERGSWCLAVLSRTPLTDVTVIELGRLPGDRVRREAIVGRYDTAGGGLLVVGTHMSHLMYGSPAHYRRLSRALGATTGAGPAVLAGDMNLWGPAVGALFPAWRRTVRGRTWPSWRPHSQIDHILLTGPVACRDAGVVRVGRSDHLAVRARLALE